MMEDSWHGIDYGSVLLLIASLNAGFAVDLQPRGLDNMRSGQGSFGNPSFGSDTLAFEIGFLKGALRNGQTAERFRKLYQS